MEGSIVKYAVDSFIQIYRFALGSFSAVAETGGEKIISTFLTAATSSFRDGLRNKMRVNTTAMSCIYIVQGSDSEVSRVVSSFGWLSKGA